MENNNTQLNTIYLNQVINQKNSLIIDLISVLIISKIIHKLEKKIHCFKLAFIHTLYEFIQICSYKNNNS